MQYYKFRSTILFRNYGDFGYLTDNRNFGYRYLNDTLTLEDKIVSDSAATILSCLSKEPQLLDSIIRKVHNIYKDIELSALTSDVCEFLDYLVKEGFVVSGHDYSECAKENRFIDPVKYQMKGTESLKSSTKKSSQNFLSDYFGDKPFPVSVHIEIASKCNERCLHCFIPHECKTEVMPFPTFEKIISQCAAMNILHITISGGEPLLHPNIINMLAICREKDLSVNVLSNLTVLTDDIANEMMKNPLLSVQTSIYAMDENIHDAITKSKGSLFKTKSAINSLLERNIPLQISCPIMKLNYEYYKEVISWAERYNISVLADYAIIAKYNHDGNGLELRLSLDEIEQFIRDNFTNNTQFKTDEENELLKNRMKSPDDYICSICGSSICIGVDGNVYPCVGWNDYVLGNIDDSTLIDIWENSPKAIYLRNLKRKDFKSCVSCLQKDYCTICMVRNSNESLSGDPFEPCKYFCNIAKIKQKVMSTEICPPSNK